MEPQERIEYFLELMSCSQNIAYWCFDAETWEMERSTSAYLDEKTFVRLAFGDKAHFESIRAYGEQNNLPLISYNGVDLCWATVFGYKDGKVNKLHILGPLYTSDISVSMIERELDKHYMSTRFRRRAITMLAGQPVLSATRFWPYVQMLHYAVNGEKVGVDAFRYDSSNAPKPKKKNLVEEESAGIETGAHAGVYQTQTELFSKIEQGDLNYSAAMNNAVSKASYGTSQFGTPGDKINAYAIKFITLSVQAAIRGGVAPVIAYSVGDYYETQIAATKSLAEKKRLLDTMFNDFVTRVHNLKARSDVSSPIRVCCDYIGLHLYDEIELEQIGRVVGYTKYYLSRKFKQEMGVSIWDYINERKIEEAKLLLADPNLTIQNVSDKLNYCSRSYFSEVFKNCTGMWPSSYRQNELHM